MCVLISIVGQPNDWCESQSVPFHQSLDVNRVVVSLPLEVNSAYSIEMTHVSMKLILFFLEYDQFFCIQISSIYLVKRLSI